MKLINKILSRLSTLSEDAKKSAIVFLYNTVKRPVAKYRLPHILHLNQPAADYLTKFSKQKRGIEILESDKKLVEVVFTCYFVKKPDPQSGVLRFEADINYIKPWYDSIKKLGIHGIIIHDGINEEFITQYQTDKIQFRRFEAGQYSLIDERWILYYIFLFNTDIKRAFFTDISDVYITRSPFREFTAENCLYIGRDNANKIRHSGWMLEEIAQYCKNSGYKPSSSLPFQAVYNVGVVGGSRKTMLFALAKVIDLILLTNSERFKEMTIFNLVIHKYFAPVLSYKSDEPKLTDARNDEASNSEYIFSGYPLNSEFKKFQFDSDAIFIHK